PVVHYYFFFSYVSDHRALHSFPTRRSSDLSAQVDDAAVQPLPNSRKIYVGPLRVPMREITQTGGNPPLVVYDTSGPYTDPQVRIDRKSTRLNSSHVKISYAVFCLKKKKKTT